MHQVTWPRLMILSALAALTACVSPQPPASQPATLPPPDDAEEAAFLTALYGNDWLSDPQVSIAADRKTLAKLRKIVPSIESENQALEKVFNHLRDEYDLNLTVSWRALEAAALDRNTPVSVHLKDLPLHAVLRELLTGIGGSETSLGWTLDRGMIIISTRDDLHRAKHQHVMVYDVREIIDRLSGERDLDAHDATQTLMAVLRESIAADTWRDNGGTIGAIREIGGYFVINQTRDNHRAIFQLLRRLEPTPQRDTRTATANAAASRTLAVAADGLDTPRFALDLYGQLAKTTKGNFICSPASINMSLAVVYAGAKGETAKQMAKTLHYSAPAEKVNAAAAALLKTLNRDPDTPDDTQLHIANAFWAQERKINADFRALINSAYRDAWHDVDFTKNANAARTSMNNWAQEQTKGKIKELVPAGALTDLTRLVVTNAIYLKSKWAKPFDPAQTLDEYFYLSADKKVQLPMMAQTESFAFYENDDLKLLEMDYKGRSLTMLVLLPKQLEGLPALEKGLTADKLREWLSEKRRHRVDVKLPKFSAQSDLNLPKTLTAMGMGDAFDPFKANFSGIYAREALYLTHVFHRAVIDLDEQGTEAAAATAVVGGLFGESPSRPKTFHANRPFLYLIRHNNTGEILFMGRLANPKGE